MLNFSKILKDVIHVLIRWPYLQPVCSYAHEPLIMFSLPLMKLKGRECWYFAINNTCEAVNSICDASNDTCDAVNNSPDAVNNIYDAG